MLGDKWLAMLTNERTFDPDSREVREASRITWVELQTDKALEIQYQVNRKSFQKDDSLFSMQAVEATYFDLSYVMHKNRVSEKDFWLTIRFFVNPSVQLTQKQVYSFLDFCRDIGGAAFLLSLISGQINAIWTYNKLENILVSQLYLKPSIWKGEIDKVGSDKALRAEEQSVSKEFCQLFRFRGRQLCCRGDQTDSFFELGRSNLSHDINLIRIVRSLRVFEQFLEESVPPDTLQTLK